MKIRAMLVMLPFLAFCLLHAPVWAVQPQKIVQPQKKSQYRGNYKSMKYHNSSCEYYDSNSCKVRFRSKKDARKAGYTPCKVCGG